MAIVSEVSPTPKFISGSRATTIRQICHRRGKIPVTSAGLTLMQLIIAYKPDDAIDDCKCRFP
jgi:hypothetical protein